jgi:hypothetical protein
LLILLQEEEQQHSSLSTQVYKLFSDKKTPLEVAIALNLGESEATKLYKEYWKLKQLYNLSMIYEEIKEDSPPLPPVKISVASVGVEFIKSSLTGPVLDNRVLDAASP